MNAKIEKSTKAKTIARISISVVLSTIAAKMIFIIFWSFTFLPIAANTPFLGSSIFVIGAIVGISVGTGCFIKLNAYLKEIMQTAF